MYMHTLIPLHVLPSAFSVYPTLQEQLKEPMVLEHLWAQTLFCTHSSMSIERTTTYMYSAMGPWYNNKNVLTIITTYRFHSVALCTTMDWMTIHCYTENACGLYYSLTVQTSTGSLITVQTVSIYTATIERARSVETVLFTSISVCRAFINILSP